MLVLVRVDVPVMVLLAREAADTVAFSELVAAADTKVVVELNELIAAADTDVVELAELVAAAETDAAEVVL